MAIKNRVISGEYSGRTIECVQNSALVIIGNCVNTPLTKREVESCTLVGAEENKNTSSIIKRGIVGGFIGGGVGAVVGSMTAKNDVSYRVMIKFKNNKSCVVELDGKFYGVLVASLS